MPKLQLREFCATRSGDKGDTANIAVFAYDDAGFGLLRDQLTADAVAAFFGPLVLGTVTRYEVPNVLALNFVLTRALGGGGPRSLRSDALGKTLGGALLRMQVDRPEGVDVRRKPPVDPAAIERWRP